MAAALHLATKVFGPFCRLRTPGESQDDATAVLQALSGEIWGRMRNGVAMPAVEAYGRGLRSGERGIEFYALTAPDREWGMRPYWTVPGSHFRIERDADGREVGKLQVAFVRITQDLLDAAAVINR
ncbi:hypothetical protein [Conexibacter woesei]|uniref:hypothetical protein n=1 Tax=Conexibacter woesei TaxID=191495 RepID=UPI00047B46D0|nr:hypothetical protein [Conexibacter woesei]